MFHLKSNIFLMSIHPLKPFHLKFCTLDLAHHRHSTLYLEKWWWEWWLFDHNIHHSLHNCHCIAQSHIHWWWHLTHPCCEFHHLHMLSWYHSLGLRNFKNKAWYENLWKLLNYLHHNKVGIWFAMVMLLVLLRNDSKNSPTGHSALHYHIQPGNHQIWRYYCNDTLWMKDIGSQC